MSNPQLDKATGTLTAQWYNAVVLACKADRNQFQLAQGNMSIGTLSEDLWNILNVVPPKSASSYFDPAQYNLFSQDYSGVMSQLIPQGDTALQSAMGDAYSEWIAFGATNKDTSPEAFKTWATLNHPSQAAQWYGLYLSVSLSPVMQAQQALYDVSQDPNKNIFAYNKTIANLKSQLAANQPSAEATIDSSSSSSDITDTWAGGGGSFFYGMFSIDGNGSYSSTASKMVESKMTVKASFEKVVTFQGGPLAEPSKDQTLKNYTPWFNSSALNIAYQTKDNTVWKYGQPSWETTFGPNGNMQRMASALIVVDGVTISVTSEASFSTADQTKIQQQVSGGFFPFFQASESSTYTNSVSFDSSGKATMTSKSMLGNPVIIGVLVDPIASVIG